MSIFLGHFRTVNRGSKVIPRQSIIDLGQQTQFTMFSHTNIKRHNSALRHEKITQKLAQKEYESNYQIRNVIPYLNLKKHTYCVALSALSTFVPAVLIAQATNCTGRHDCTCITLKLAQLHKLCVWTKKWHKPGHAVHCFLHLCAPPVVR